MLFVTEIARVRDPQDREAGDKVKGGEEGMSCCETWMKRF